MRLLNKRVFDLKAMSLALIPALFFISFTQNVSANDKDILIEALENELIDSCVYRSEEGFKPIECLNDLTYLSGSLRDKGYTKTDELIYRLKQEAQRKHFIRNTIGRDADNEQ